MTPARRYRAVASQTASRERLLVMLLYAAQTAMGQARTALAQGSASTAASLIDKAVAIVSELDATLDHTREPTLTAQLSDVYAFVAWRLIHAKNAHQAVSIDEALRAFAPIVGAFSTAVGLGANEVGREQR